MTEKTKAKATAGPSAALPLVVSLRMTDLFGLGGEQGQWQGQEQRQSWICLSHPIDKGVARAGHPHRGGAGGKAGVQSV